MSISEYYRPYYSQNREDIILAVFLDSVKKGFYIDVGAGDPVNDSVTYYFYKSGWRGVNIEPNETIFKKLESKRKRDININLGISNTKGKKKLRIYSDEMQGQSTYSEKIKIQKSKEDDSLPYKDVVTEVERLDKVLEQNLPEQVKDIHFMKIDVEGFEGEVLHGNDWGKFRPWVLCIEADHLHEDWRTYLKENGYNKVFSDGLNDYFIEQSHTQLINNLEHRYVSFVINHEQPFLHNRVINQMLHLESDLEQLKGSLRVNQQEKEQLKNELNKFRSIRVTARHLSGLLMRNIRMYFGGYK